MQNICKQANVKPFGFHSIRHLTATMLYKNGCKRHAIQSVLRHKSASTTEKYLHQLGLNDDLKNELQNFMPELMN